MTTTGNPTGETTLADLSAKLDRVLAFLDQLEPYLPQLAKFAALADNPATRFLTRSKR